jgi:alpha-amylase
MRLATYEHLIAAEDLADEAGGRMRTSAVTDTDADGLADVLLNDAGQVVTVDLDEGAGIGSWDVRAVRHALAAVLRRRPEAYHERLRAHEAALAAGAGGPGGVDGEGVTSIHEIVQVKEPGLARRLHYDDHERRSGLVRFLPPRTSARSWAQGTARELGDALDGSWSVASLRSRRLVTEKDATVRIGQRSLPVHLVRTLTLGGGRRRPTLTLELEVENRSGARIEARLGIEWALTMLGGGGNPAAWWDVAGRRTAHDAAGTAKGVAELAQGNDDIGLAVVTRVAGAADAWWAPIDTISNSEAGFERVYQGSGLLLSWALALEPGTRQTVRIEHRVATSLDRRADQTAGAPPA